MREIASRVANADRPESRKPAICTLACPESSHQNGNRGDEIRVQWLRIAIGNLRSSNAPDLLSNNSSRSLPQRMPERLWVGTSSTTAQESFAPAVANTRWSDDSIQPQPDMAIKPSFAIAVDTSSQPSSDIV